MGDRAGLSRNWWARLAIIGCALAVLVGLERLIEHLVLRIGARPIGFLWGWVGGQLRGLPQAELWAVLVACFGLLGLRSLGFRVAWTSAARRGNSPSQGSLQGWLELLDDHTRGEYFRWRLARRAASLNDDIGPAAPATDPRIEAFLQAGRQSRTIRPQGSRAELRLEPEILVEYLEGKQELRGAP